MATAEGEVVRWSLVAEVPADGRPDDFVQSVGRAMRVLEVVGREPGLPVKAIARKCALNISTSYHLVRTLAYEGYLVRLPNGTYVIGETRGPPLPRPRHVARAAARGGGGRCASSRSGWA